MSNRRDCCKQKKCECRKCKPRCKPKKCYVTRCGKKYEKCEKYNDCCDDKCDKCEIKCKRCTVYTDFVKIGTTVSDKKVNIKAIRKGNLITLDFGEWVVPNVAVQGKAIFQKKLDSVYVPTVNKYYLVRASDDNGSLFGISTLVIKTDGGIEWGFTPLNVDFLVTNTAVMNSTGVNYSV